MSERTGLGPIEEAILLTLGEMSASSTRHRKNASVLAEVEKRAGLGPRYVYKALCDLSRPWKVWLPLVDFHGNHGSPDFGAAEPQYTESKLSKLGRLALDWPLPVALVNGTHYAGGTQPPFEPGRVVDGLLRVIADPHVSDADLVELAGPPAFPTGCGVSGDIAALVAGREAGLDLTAVIRRSSVRGHVALEVSGLPPGVGASDITGNISGANVKGVWRTTGQTQDDVRRLLRDVTNLSTGEEILIRCLVRDDADPDDAEANLRRIWGMSIDPRFQLPAPLAKMLRAWVSDHATAETPAVLQEMLSCAPAR